MYESACSSIPSLPFTACNKTFQSVLGKQGENLRWWGRSIVREGPIVTHEYSWGSHNSPVVDVTHKRNSFDSYHLLPASCRTSSGPPSAHHQPGPGRLDAILPESGASSKKYFQPMSPHLWVHVHLREHASTHTHPKRMEYRTQDPGSAVQAQALWSKALVWSGFPETES